MHLKEGYRLHDDKYQLVDIIGEGGFSLTYKGIWNTEVQGLLGKMPTKAPVCIKEYFFKDYCLRDPDTFSVKTSSTSGKEIFDKYKEKLIKEAGILSEINHPNVVNVLDFFRQNNTVYIVMEFISGQSLKQKLEKNNLFSEPELLKIIYKIGQALQFIHDKNILHLDIKPSNILMDGNNNPKLIDFGISKRYGLSNQQETSTTMLAVSKGYASIEQYDSEGMQVFSPCPDIYSLGATMYFLLTGQVPTESILRSTKGLESPRTINPNISEKTDQVILKAMALNSSERYQSVMDMIIDLGFDKKTDKILLTSDPDENNDEKTTLIPQENNTEDNTIFQFDSKRLEKKNPKKNRKWIYASILFLLIALCFIFIIKKSSVLSFNNNKQIVLDENQLNYEKFFRLGVQQFFNQNFSQSKEEFLKAYFFKERDEVKIYLSKIDSLITQFQNQQTLIPNQNSKTNVPTSNLSSEIKEITRDSILDNYTKSFDSALIYFQNQNYTKAKKDFEKALSFKKTTVVENYINLCNSELKKEEIQKRKDLYEIKMELGTFVVVRRKSDGLYGAIDSQGIEKIPCKYISSEKSGDNRFFVRKDNLYDVYDSSGTLVQEGISGF